MSSKTKENIKTMLNGYVACVELNQEVSGSFEIPTERKSAKKLRVEKANGAEEVKDGDIIYVSSRAGEDMGGYIVVHQKEIIMIV